MSLDPKTLRPVNELESDKEKITKQNTVEKPTMQKNNNLVEDISELNIEDALKAVESLTENQENSLPVVGHIDIAPEHEIISMDNFDHNSLKTAIEAYNNYFSKDPEKAFLVGISEYIKNLNSLKVVGKEIQNEIRKKPTAWMSYEHKIKSSFITEQKMYQIEALIKMCKGTNPYKITMQQQIIAQGNDLDANRFDTLADYLNI
jgi:hypothetical protein